MKCFRKLGITWASFSVVSRSYEDEDPFDDVEAQEELQDLVQEISLSEIKCPAEKVHQRRG